MRLAWTFGAESLATHPFRTERGKSGPPSSSLDRRKAGPAPEQICGRHFPHSTAENVYGTLLAV